MNVLMNLMMSSQKHVAHERRINHVHNPGGNDPTKCVCMLKLVGGSTAITLLRVLMDCTDFECLHAKVPLAFPNGIISGNP